MQMERIKYKGNFTYVDIDDILDILETAKEKYYSIIFKDGDFWLDVQLTKSFINKFNKIKRKRNQK